jgi:ribosomal protein L28
MSSLQVESDHERIIKDYKTILEENKKLSSALEETRRLFVDLNVFYSALRSENLKLKKKLKAVAEALKETPTQSSV